MDKPEGDVPVEFVRHVARALRRLYDPPGLVRSPLIDWLIPPDPSPERRSQQLRALLLQTIASLSPGEGVSFRALSTRSYEAVHLHYVEGHTFEEVSRYLALSVRQAYRDIRRGEADIATLLWCRGLSGSDASQQGGEEALQQEIGRLPQIVGRAPLRESLESASAALGALNRKFSVGPAEVTMPRESAVRCDTAGLRQCLTAVLSYAVQAGAQGGSVSVEVSEDERLLHLTVCREAAVADLTPLDSLLATARGLAHAIGGDLEAYGSEQRLWMELELPPAPASILVVDDNEGLAQLVQRFLGDRHLEISGTTDPLEALERARACPPGAILLDILMPGIDGWSVLAQMKADPLLARVPVIVCSVFNDPGLAQSLGATAFLAKPFSQSALLQTLAPLGLL